MYIDKLQSPHPTLVTPEQPARPFLETLPTQPLPTALTLEAARLAVRQALRWDGVDAHATTTGSSVDTVRVEQTTDCLGYTTALSESLQYLGVDHYIGFGNTHAFVVAPTDEGLYFEDALFNGLSGPMDKALAVGSPQQIASDVTAHKKAAVLLNTSRLGTLQGVISRETYNKYKWLYYASKQPHYIQEENLSSRRDSNARSLNTFAVTLFPSPIGRAVLQQWGGFYYALQHTEPSAGDYDKAFKHLRAMRGFYPEVDARNDHEHFRKKLFTHLLKQRQFERCREALDYYFSSFGGTNDPRLSVLEGDLARQLASAAKEPRDAELAIQAYERAAAVARYGKEMLRGKIRATKSLATAFA